jgi:hypothetical protein
MESYSTMIKMRELLDLYRYWKKSFSAPAPSKIKRAVLERHGLSEATWVETGTYFGDTTKFLSKKALYVHSIEPQPEIFAIASKRLRLLPNITLHNGTSEEMLVKILPNLHGNVCFWLDGHYSGGNTFRGPSDTPLMHELEQISKLISNWDAVVIAIDDIRLCGQYHVYGSYPELNYLVEFAKSNNLDWQIEHDIFVAKSK